MNDGGSKLRSPPKGLFRWLLRVPIYIYRAGLGFVFGHRFLMMTHHGRKTGRRRYVVVEVVDRDRAHNRYYIASGFGEKSDWLRNIQHDRRVEVRVAFQRFQGNARRLSPDEAVTVLRTYAQAHPRALRNLASFLLDRDTAQAADLPERLSEVVPIVELSPV
jgi:deazaflavin-dependent oxidoreductase (nitroreductase family)